MRLNYAVELEKYDIADQLKRELATMFERHNMKPAKRRHTDAPAGHRTRYRRFVNTCASFEDLGRLGYRIQRLANLAEKHVAALVKSWEAAGQMVGTIENKLSYLRWLARFLGKPGMVKAGKTYCAHPEKFKRSTVATEDKSWSGNGVDALAVVEKLRALDHIVAAQVEIVLAIGVRAEEAILARPCMALEDALARAAVRIEHGTKGGRPRDVLIDDVVQIDVFARAAMLARAPSATMIPANRTLNQWKSHFYYVLRKCGIKKDTSDGGLGITLHGARHDYLQKRFELVTGMPAPIKGADVQYDRDLYAMAMSKVVELAGHSDRYKSGAYLGSSRGMRRLRLALENHRPGE